MTNKYLFKLSSDLHSRFSPDLTPEQMEQIGVLTHPGSKYFDGNPKENFFGIRASLDKWPEGWHNEEHPKGWFQWYRGYAQGKRTPDDERQIKRWLSFKARHLAQLQKADPELTSLHVQPKRRQALLNWGIAPGLDIDRAVETGNVNKYLEKVSELYAHTTSISNLEKLLATGKIRSLESLSRVSPDTIVSVEPLPIPFLRESLPATQAVEKMRGIKEVDRIFLTKGVYLPTYGEATVVKDLLSPTRRVSLNTIPEEHTTKRNLSLTSNATVYVPSEKIEELRSKYSNVKFLPQEENPLTKDSLLFRISNYPRKLGEVLGIEKGASFSARNISSTAFLGGSTGLGISADTSDLDYFAPYRSQNKYLAAVQRVKEKYPELQERAWTLNRGDKTSLTGVIDGKEVDVILAVGEKAKAYEEKYKSLKDSLTEEQKQAIIAKKQELKTSWILPEIRYKWYKDSLSKELGLKQLYF